LLYKVSFRKNDQSYTSIKLKMSNITYYKATSEDVQLLAEYRIRFALELSGEQAPETIQMLKEQMLTYFSTAISQNTCISMIAKCDGKVAGIGSFHIREMPGNFKNPSGKWGYIMNMYTVPEFRRKGVCKNILNLLVEEGRKQGITAFDLHATKEGELVYKQNGFEIYNEPTYRKFLK
jgi:predicted acetyltransferase